MKPSLSCLFLFALAQTDAVAFGGDRDWKDSEGQNWFKADLITANSSTARLKLSDDGRVYEVPLQVLSEEDQKYVRDRFQSAADWQQSDGTIPADVLAQIKQRAVHDWPSDYNMQRYVVKQQKQAYLYLQSYSSASIPPPVVANIMRTARERWPADYGMQKTFVEQQTTAFGGLQRGD